MDLHKSLNEYKFYLKIERGLSDNSIKSYETDLNKFIKYINSEKINQIKEIKEIHIKKFIKTIRDKINPRSQARLTSSLKSFASSNWYIFACANIYLGHVLPQ